MITIIWAILSTFTVFFGGFFGGCRHLNSERVPFKKFFGGQLFILPWAIPAIITQMVFANIFNDDGVRSIISWKIWDCVALKFLKNWKMLGLSFEQFKEDRPAENPISGMTTSNVVGNPHNKWFVRISLTLSTSGSVSPMHMALMTYTMTGIDRTFYEAADIDWSQQMAEVLEDTFPLPIRDGDSTALVDVFFRQLLITSE